MIVMMMMLTVVVPPPPWFRPFSSDGQSHDYNYYPSNTEVEEAPARRFPIHYLPTRYRNGKGGAKSPVKRIPLGYRSIGKWRLTSGPDPPTFTPYIGAESLTNLPGFFKHLRENLDAIVGGRGSRRSKFNRKVDSRLKNFKAKANKYNPGWLSLGLGKREN